MASLKHKAERAAFDVAITAALKHVDKGRGKAMCQLIDLVQKVLKDTWPDAAYDALRGQFEDPDSKWMKFTNKIFDEVDPRLIKMAALNLGYESAFRGYKDTRALGEKENCNIPWTILVDPTSACNLHCTGCWAAEYGNKLNLTYDELDKLITEGEEMGIHNWLFTGGEPLVRKADLIKLAKKHNTSYFQPFTNATLIDEEFCKEVKECGNMSFAISVEGFAEANDGRRGQGVFDKVMHAMDLLKKYKLFFGCSICYTHINYKNVTSDEFLDLLVEKGARYIWYFHYMPTGAAGVTELCPTPEEREYMFHRVREIRGFKGGKPIFALDFQNDGEFVGGCVAGGREYCHINARGDVDPCVFIHYSSANIRRDSLLDCFKQPIFQLYREQQPFNKNMLQPCPMLENPSILGQLVKEGKAVPTDPESPESTEDLFKKTEPYAKAWAPVAKRLWAEEHPDRVEKEPEKAEDKATQTV